MTDGTPKVFICDPNPFALDGAQRAFRQAGLNVVGATTDPSTRLTGQDTQRPVIYFVDYTPGEMFGASLITRLLRADASRRIVVYSSLEYVSAIAAAYEAGASAFVRKGVTMHDVLEVIGAVHRLTNGHDRHFPGTLGQDLAVFYVSGGRADASPQELLTGRQLEIFVMVAKGLQVTQIANRLQLDRRTVSNHLVAIRKRLSIPREHFRSCAIENKLIDAPYSPHGRPISDDASQANRARES